MELKHKDMTEEELFNNIVKLYKDNPKIVIQPDVWLEMRKEYLNLNSREEQLKWLKELKV